jgi:hypothetical protein
VEFEIGSGSDSQLIRGLALVLSVLSARPRINWSLTHLRDSFAQDSSNFKFLSESHDSR